MASLCENSTSREGENTAIVRHLRHQVLERGARRTEAEYTYAIVIDDGGNKWLQLDTYGSSERQIPGKKSQSIRFSPEAIEQLRQIVGSL